MSKQRKVKGADIETRHTTDGEAAAMLIDGVEWGIHVANDDAMHVTFMHEGDQFAFVIGFPLRSIRGFHPAVFPAIIHVEDLRTLHNLFGSMLDQYEAGVFDRPIPEAN